MTGRREVEELTTATFKPFAKDWARMAELYARRPGVSVIVRHLIRNHLRQVEAELEKSRAADAKALPTPAVESKK